jgi:hypothetical protein
MSHISAIGAGMYSDLSVSMSSTPYSNAFSPTEANLKALFATEIASVGGTKAANTFVRVKNVRSFPAMGTPPNIVNVPTYGQPTSQQIQGQADAPSMDVTLNFVASDWSKDVGVLLGNMVGDGNQYIFRFALLNSLPTGSGATQYASTASGLGVVANSQYFWVGKIDALQVTPNLTDANTAVITMTLQSAVYGAFTST